MKLNEFLGNQNAKYRLTKWLNEFFDKKTDIPYCILYGNSGCGKTTLIQILAKEYALDLLSITPSDINSKDDLNNFIKSINVTSLEGIRHKIILVDDINEFQTRYRNELVKIKSINPIIFTSRNLSKLPRDFTGKSLRVKVLRPSTREVYQHLKSLNSELSDDILKKIASESTSIRSAVLSLYNTSANDMIIPVQTKAEALNSIKKRELKTDLDYPMILYIFNSIREYNKDALKVMFRIADFDWQINKYRNITQYPQDNIDCFFVNNMIEPIDKLKLKYIYKERNNNKKKDEKKKQINKQEKLIIDLKEKRKEKEEEKKGIVQASAIDSWI